MPTEVIKTIKPSGGDYTSLFAFEVGEQRDLVALDEIAVAECYAMSDTTPVNFFGWTTDETHYIKIYTPRLERHNGKWNDSAYRMEIVPTANNQEAIRMGNDINLVIDGIQINIDVSVYGSIRAIYDGNTVDFQPQISNCIIKGIGVCEGSTSAGIEIGGTPTPIISAKIWNNYIYNFIDPGDPNKGRGIRFRSSNTTKNNYLYNNSIISCGIGIQNNWSTILLKNNIVQDCDIGYDINDLDTNSTNNHSSIGDAPGLNPISGNVIFVDSGNEDYHLSSDDTVAQDAGVKLAADPNLPFNTDIDGQLRLDYYPAWDLGADEIYGDPWSEEGIPDVATNWSLQPVISSDWSLQPKAI